MPIIYHVTKRSDWEEAIKKNEYTHPALTAEGFIHCSQEEQVAGVLQRYFAGQSDLVRLTIDTDKLIPRWVFEWSPSTHDSFPHVYGPINLDAVIEVSSL